MLPQIFAYISIHICQLRSIITPDCVQSKFSSVQFVASKVPSFLHQFIITKFVLSFPMANENINSTEYHPFHVREAPRRVPQISFPTPDPLIPGPAGPIQIAIARRKKNRVSFPNQALNDPTTQQFIAEVLAQPAPYDTDFNQANWTSAIEYATKEGYMITDSEEAIWTPINVIHNTRGNWAKIDKMVNMIDSFTPNGLGDAMVTLKDPTGIIDASIHWKVFENEEYARTIGVGAVLLLQKVTVTKLTGRTKYVNITAKNITGVIGKDDMIYSTGGEGEDTRVDDEETLLLTSIVPDSEEDI